MGNQIISGNLKNMKMDSDKIQYVFKRKFSGTICAITILYILILTYMLTIIAINNRIADVFLLLLFMVLLLFFFADNLCWQLNGKEVISFEREGILILKKGRLINSRKFICYEKISDIFYEQMKYSALRSWGIFWGRKGGSIKIEYGGGSFCYFGQSLSYNEAMHILPEIIIHIKHYTESFKQRRTNNYNNFEKLWEEIEQ